jgi:hypothetical protein
VHLRSDVFRALGLESGEESVDNPHRYPGQKGLENRQHGESSAALGAAVLAVLAVFFSL